MKYTIIGNSAAAIGAVEGIRQIDADGEIVIITNEPHHTYSRPLISYLLRGKVTQENMKYRPDDFYSHNNCTVVHGCAAQIKPADKHVLLKDGKRISYDKLLVAAGSSAFVPPFVGLDTVKEKFTFMSLDDAQKLDKALDKNKKVLIIGAGLIGLKCAEGILDRSAQVTVLDLAPNILSSILDADSAKMVQKHLEEKGIKFKLSDAVKQFEGKVALLNSSEKIDFDLLVLAVGVRPNTILLKNIAKTERGIVINAKSQTSAPDIYAAGDCTQTYDVSSGENKNMALLPNAYMQGECAGINMAGGEKTFDKAIPMNAIGFFGFHIITAGTYTGGSYTEASGKKYKCLFYADNKLKGYILAGDIEKSGIYTSMIRERTALDSIDFKLICKKPGLMAFTQEERKAKLGGKK
ncbi:NAD(P)H-nitrite reductase large subunit [Elusimicrobium posterum]|uniref:NAD(P)/FAD-dependent oxidoreductase n=1 Tax=Elusimicrobium posterum TaxID=3116653 RepID=UPI003C7117ED